MSTGLLILSRLLGYLMYYYKKQNLGINYIDSTRIPVCHNKRTNSHKVFESVAEIGKSTMGWFLGFKLHLVIDTRGNILSVNLTKGNVDDRVPVAGGQLDAVLVDRRETVGGRLGEGGRQAQGQHAAAITLAANLAEEAARVAVQHRL